ncbi:hypothetical protein TA3x_004316 [Tundrisphaera sp. TA3]|uniref:hypothetical protein n=1 Tax=Tundrisphaera sp. TA3 TaxID=3435775 RepID=UPI003EBA0D4F
MHRPRWRQASITDSNPSANRLPSSLADPRLSFRQITPCLNARSAALLPGGYALDLGEARQVILGFEDLPAAFAVHAQPHAATSGAGD